MYGCLLLLIIPVLINCKYLLPNWPGKHYTIPGDINLGVIVPIHDYSVNQPCGQGIAIPEVMQMVAAKTFAVQLINKRTDLLPGVKLGFTILDSCMKDSTALVQAMSFMSKQQTSGNQTIVPSEMSHLYQATIKRNGERIAINEHFIGIIGAVFSSVSIQVRLWKQYYYI